MAKCISSIISSVLVCLLLSGPVWAQTTTIRGATKGSSTAQPVTSTSVDANHTALDVNIAAGGGTGGGPADAAPNAAASESDAARQKVTSALRLYDTGQAAGSQMVTAKGDQTNGLWVNCKSGCAGAAGDGTGSGTITAGGQRVSLALSTYAGSGVTITGTWSATLKPQVSYDGGTTWVDTVFFDVATRAIVSTTSSNASYALLATGGASHVAITTTAFTSGTVNIALRTTASFTPYETIAGTVTANQGGTWTVQPGNTANTTPWLATINQGGNSATVTAGNALKVDGSAVTQPVSGTVTANAGTGTFFDGIIRDGTGDTTQANVTSGRLNVDGSGVTQPVSGTVTANAGTGNFSENLAQVAGSTVTTVATGTQKVGIADSGGTAFLSAANALNSTGGGIQAAQIVGQFDDVTPTAITENQFGNVRMSANRNLFGTIRDAAGNERGANVTAGNALVVDGSASTQPVSGTLTVTQGTGTNLHIVCDSGCGGGTQYAEDTAHVSGDQLSMAGVVQQTADTALAADGDRTALQVDANGYLKVNIKAGAGSGGTAATDNSAFTGGSTSVTPMGALYDTTPPAITDGNIGAPRMDSSRYLYVDCVVGCSGSSFADNSAFTFGTTNITPMGYVFDDTAPNAVTENNAATPRMSANRVPYAQLRDAAGNERGANVNASNELLVALSSVPSHNVTNAGTFAVQATQSGTWNVTNISGTVSLPTGASTLAEQQTQTTALQLIDNLPLTQGAATAGQSGVLTQGAVTTAAPTYTTGNTNPLSLNTAGGLRVDGSGVTQPVSGTVSVSGSVTVTDGAGALNVIVDSGTTAVTQATASNLNAQVQGAAASGAAKSGNPVQVGGVFNTTQPTVTTGQAVEAQATARGALIIAKGVDGFALDANQSVNVAQMNGTAVTMGNGIAGTGVQRVTIASDSTGTVAVTQATAANLNATVVGTLADDGVAAATNRVGTLPAIAQTGYNSSTAGRNTALNTVAGSGLGMMAALPETGLPSYTASAVVSSAASATDIAVLPGNATNTVLVTEVRVSCTQTTAGIIELHLVKRSTADTAGTSSGMTEVPDDSSYAAASSAALTYTANPTTGSTVGDLDIAKLGCMATGTAAPNDVYIANFRQKPIVLRGTAQQLAINLNGATVSGGSFAVTFKWLEISGL